MAQIYEDSLVVTASRIGKVGEAGQTTMFDNELIATIESVVQELVGDKYLVEVKIK